MGFEVSGDGKMMGLLRVNPRHKRSKSFPEKKRVHEAESDSSYESSDRIKLDMAQLKGRVTTTEKQSPTMGAHNSLKQEIMQLEKRLQIQFEVRHALENALGYKSSIHNNSINTNGSAIPKPATELIKEIAVLELEVGHLEQYLLSQYRKAFDEQSSCVSSAKKDNRSKSPVTTPRNRLLEISKPEMALKRENLAVQSGGQSLEYTWKEYNGIGQEEKLLNSSVHRCHSSLSQHSAYVTRTFPPEESLAKALRSCHSQPLSMMEYAQNASPNIISLAEHLGTRISDHIQETPNRLSEEMIKCMSTIYCKLADPPLTQNGLSSPNSSLSSTSEFSPQDHVDIWSPQFRNNSSFDVRLDNPFLVEGLKEFSGPYSTMVEVPWIHRDSNKLGDIEHMLQHFRSLISRLEEVDPRKLNNDEKLAFWINVHNTLVMHAYLAYGVPQNNVKRVFLLLKAAYNIGGHTISADTMQSSILGCRMSRPGQWLRLLLTPRSKFKAGDDRQAYAIDHPEPILHFALCSGSHSDPAVRAYTPKRLHQELEAAKEEYLRATFGVRKDHKILLPKIVESFTKSSDLCPSSVLEMIQQSLPESLRKSIKKCLLAGKSSKSKSIIEWIPHNFTFRYLISKELVK